MVTMVAMVLQEKLIANAIPNLLIWWRWLTATNSTISESDLSSNSLESLTQTWVQFIFAGERVTAFSQLCLTHHWT
jgi:hypothetical protein